MKKRLFVVFIIIFFFVFNGFSQRASDFFDRGIYFKEQKNYDSAIACFSNALLLKLKYQDAYIERAFCYVKINRFDSAACDYKTLAKYYSNNEDYLKTAGRYFIKAADYTEAVNALIAYNKIRPADESVVIDLLNAFNGNNEYNNALAFAKKHEINFASNPYFIYAKFVAGRGAFPYEDLSAEALKAAEGTFKSAVYIKTPQRYHDFISAYAAMLTANEKYAKAIVIYNELIKNESNNSYYYYEKSKCYYSLNNLDSALFSINNAFRLSPTNGDYFMHRAAIFSKLHDNIRSCSDYNTAYEILKSCEAIEKCVECKKSENNLFGAEPYLRKAVELNCTGRNYKMLLNEIDSVKSAYHLEKNKPNIVLTSPLPLNNTIPLTSINDAITLRGYIDDESKIKLIYINGLPLPAKNNFEFEIPVIVSPADSIVIGAVDIWDNVNAEKYYFRLMPENIDIAISITEPVADGLQIIPPARNDISFYISGKIKCQSDKIKSIIINNEHAKFNADEFNPEFSGSANIEKADSVLIDILTINGIKKKFAFVINRKAAKN